MIEQSKKLSNDYKKTGATVNSKWSYLKTFYKITAISSNGRKADMRKILNNISMVYCTLSFYVYKATLRKCALVTVNFLLFCLR